MISNYDALGIYDSLNIIHLNLQDLTSLAIVIREGILKADAVGEVSAGCVECLYLILKDMAEEMEQLTDEFRNLLKRDETEDHENGI